MGALEDASPRPLNKINLIGRPHQRGDLESRLAIEFDALERSLAAKAFDELRSAGFIVPTFSDIVRESLEIAEKMLRCLLVPRSAAT